MTFEIESLKNPHTSAKKLLEHKSFNNEQIGYYAANIYILIYEMRAKLCVGEGGWWSCGGS